MTLARRGLSGLAATALVIVLVAPAWADEGLYLNWDACGPSGPALRTSACDANAGDQRLYCGFMLAEPIDQVAGVEIVVDLSHSEASLPSWWQLGVGGCRFGSLTADGGPVAGEDCLDPWQGKATGGVQGYAVGQPFGGPNQARIKIALSVLAAEAFTLEAGVLYQAARIVLNNARTTGTPSCAGCGPASCMVLNSIWIKRVPGAPGGDVFLQTPGPGNGNVAEWQAAASGCQAVPVRRGTWGAIKSLYR